MERYEIRIIADVLERALMELRYRERLSQEAGMEELCKILLIKLSYERQNKRIFTLVGINDDGKETVESTYNKLFLTYVSSSMYKGWEHIDIKSKTFYNILNQLRLFSFSDVDNYDLGNAFTLFLQRYYAWNVNDYSTPSVLINYIFDVLDVNDYKSFYDPCCGIGGMLATACNRKGNDLVLGGNDINRTMVNITRLHLNMYGYNDGDITCRDYTERDSMDLQTRYDCIVAQLPTRRQSFSLTGRAKGESGYDYVDSEFVFIKKILDQLNYNGIAAIVVSDSVVEDRWKKSVREYIYNNSEILNISKLENVVAKSNFHKQSYYILFVKKNVGYKFGQCSATLINSDADEIDKKEAAQWIRNYIKYGISIKEHHLCKLYDHWDCTNWNLSLLFIRDKIGNEYNPVMLNDILVKSRDRAIIKPEENYKVLRVSRHGMGVGVKRVQKGDSFQERMYIARANDLLVSSFEVDYGGVGYVPKELDGSLVTKDFFLFTVDKSRVDLNYLLILLTSGPVLEQLQTMNKRAYPLSRLSMSKFLSVIIPLPDLYTQKTLAKDLQRYIDKLRRAEDELAGGRKSFNKIVFGIE